MQYLLVFITHSIPCLLIGCAFISYIVSVQSEDEPALWDRVALNEDVVALYIAQALQITHSTNDTKVSAFPTKLELIVVITSGALLALICICIIFVAIMMIYRRRRAK